MAKNVIELFCGYGIVARAFEESGFKTWKTDIRKRKGVCDPDLKKNILQLSSRDIFEHSGFQKIDVLWASPPCDVWSYASGNFHWDKEGNPKTKKCHEHIEILMKTLKIIDELKPKVFFIENPRGRLRFFLPFVKWLKKHGAVMKTITYSSYGYPSPKPTNIFTTAREISFKDMDSFGRGAKNRNGFKMDNISVCQKQKVPGAFAEAIVKYFVEEKVETNCNICRQPIEIDKRALRLCDLCSDQKCQNCGHIRASHVDDVGSCIHEFSLRHKTKRGEFCDCESFIQAPQ